MKERMALLMNLASKSEAVEGFIFSALENQIEGNLGSTDDETATQCGLTTEEFRLVCKVVYPDNGL